MTSTAIEVPGQDFPWAELEKLRADNAFLLAERDTAEIATLSRDLRKAAGTLGKREGRFLVDLYYQLQEYREAANSQVKSMAKHEEPHAVLTYFGQQMTTLERQAKAALAHWVNAAGGLTGEWALAQTGVGPVLTAGLLTHLNIEHLQTAGQLWAFAGLNPEQEWKKGQRRPWNAKLKVLCYKIGESFVKHQNRDGCFYGQIYAERKTVEIIRNERGDFADQAAAALQKRNFGKETEARKHYVAGRLPPAHIHARARRYAVKLFLAHFFEVAYREHHGKEPPLPYPIQRDLWDGRTTRDSEGGLTGHGHRHPVEPPHLPDALRNVEPRDE